MPDPEIQQAPIPSSPPSALRILSACLLFLLGFTLAAILLHLTLPDPLHLHADVRSEKLAMLQRLHGSVYSAAFGSSRVHDGFDPRTFDAVLTKAPTIQSHTVNLGVEGGSQAEQRALALDFIHQLPSPPPGESCLILLELKAGANFQNMHLVHPRAINIYDWPTTRFIAHLTTPGMSLSQRIGRIGYALSAMLLHYANVGMIGSKIFSPPLNRALLEDELKEDRRGLKIDPFSPSDQPSINRQLFGPPSHSTSADVTLTPGNTALISELASASVRNLDFAYFVMPTAGDISQTQELPNHLSAAGRDIPILNLARPDLFPAFYQPAMFHDVGHLSAAGAALAGEMLAAQLKAWYAAHGGPPLCGATGSPH